MGLGVTAKIRAARLDDAAAIAGIYAPYVAETPISLETVVPGSDEIANRMATLCPAYPWLVYDIGGSAKGYAYAGPHSERGGYRWSANATVYVARGYHRMGIGRSLYARLLSILRRQGFHAIFGGITLPNAASVGLHEAFGFSAVGVYRQAGFKMGAWWDVGWWGCVLDQASPDPAPPRAFSEDLLEETSPGLAPPSRGWVWCR